MVDSSGEGPDRAGPRLGAVSMDVLPFDSIFLVTDAEGRIDSRIKCLQWCVIWDNAMLGIPKGDVANLKCFSLFALWLLGVFANSEEVVECNIGQVRDGAVLVAVVAFTASRPSNHVFDEANWNRKLW